MCRFYNTYTPKLLARVRASHLTRNQISFQFGSSSTSSLTPSITWSPKALVNVGGAYAFDGTTVEREGTFYFDISNVFTASSVNDQLFYLTYTDSTTGNVLSINEFDVVDPVTNASIYISTTTSKTVDGGSGRLIAGNYTPDLTAPSSPTVLNGSVVSSKRGKKVTTSIKLSWGASSDNVGVSKYRVYRNGAVLAETTSLSYSDSNGSKGVSYTYEVTALDAAGNESNKSNSVVLVK